MQTAATVTNYVNMENPRYFMRLGVNVFIFISMAEQQNYQKESIFF